MARVNSVHQNMVWNSRKLGSLTGVHHLPIKEYFSVGALVIRLLLSGCPNAVIFAVRSVIVLALYGVPFAWPNTHVAKECREVIYPLRSHKNTSPAIPRVSNGLFVVTPKFHSIPCGVFGGSKHPVFCFCFDSPLCLKASARLGFPGEKRGCGYNLFFSALTPAQPSRFSGRVWTSKRNYHQSTVSHVRFIHEPVFVTAALVWFYAHLEVVS